MAHSKNMTRSIAMLRKEIVGYPTFNGNTFESTIIPNPHLQPLHKKRELIKYFGNRIQSDKHCLDITEDTVRENIEEKNYSALVKVLNVSVDDSTTCSLQYWDHCKKGTPQLWIHDLCRVNNSGLKPKITPTMALINTVELFAMERDIPEIFLLVKVGKNSTGRLQGIYEEYGFLVDETCIFKHNIVMKKVLPLR